MSFSAATHTLIVCCISVHSRFDYVFAFLLTLLYIFFILYVLHIYLSCVSRTKVVKPPSPLARNPNLLESTSFVSNITQNIAKAL